MWKRALIAARDLPWRWRLPLYIGVFAFAIVLDSKTPFGPAEWLLEVVTVWIAASLGGMREMFLVAAIASACIFIGLWISPVSNVPLHSEMLNRVAAFCFICLIAYTTRRRRL